MNAMHTQGGQVLAPPDVFTTIGLTLAHVLGSQARWELFIITSRSSVIT
jgi:hypothetical protein